MNDAKRLLLVTGTYSPYINANTNCVGKIVPALQQAGFSVSVLTLAYEKGLPEVEEKDGCTIYRAAVPEIAAIDRALYQNPRLNAGVLRIARGVIGKTAYAYTDLLKKRRIRKVFARTGGNFSRILSVINPVDAHDFACQCKTGKEKWILYYLDSYVFNEALSGSPKRRMARERRWARKADGVIHSAGMREENARHGYDPFGALPQIDVPLPNFEIRESDFVGQVRHDGADRIILRYTGMFYSNIRRPDELLRFLDTLDPDRYTVEFYGPCCDYMRMHFQKMPLCLHLMGTVSTQQCRDLTAAADVLLNVGNTAANQVPSKVFEYIASGKPILNFYTNELEPGLAYLRRYPCALNVRTADEVTQHDLDALLQTSGTITPQTLREIYADCLRENVVQRIVDFIESVE